MAATQAPQRMTVKGSTTRKIGSGESRRLRAAGQLPGVLYGLDKDPVPVSVAYTDLRDALKGPRGMNTVLELELDGDVSETVIVRTVQRDEIKRVVTHADFLRIDPTQTVNVKVPVHLTGDESGVTNNGGLIEQNLFELEIEALPAAVPNEILADISIMTLERSLSVADLNLPEGVTSLIEDEISVAASYMPRAAEEAKPAEDGDEAAEASAGSPAEDGEASDAGEGES